VNDGRIATFPVAVYRLVPAAECRIEQFRWPGESPSPATTATHLSQLVQRFTQAEVTRLRRSTSVPFCPHSAFLPGVEHRLLYLC
jgi:hypothetical protein